ncbi:TonB-dependent receptor [Novosphingobium sp. Rr 2-17]|uniref:TonB-dependent receptor n=1 Tax=Novosphingobium sp. Rr 2-17 TaxID=555793 RepID=UPI000269A4A7|nr:TonB-dependent receptor [Novosphingobium sp. Rr 2-17]EIZ80906.1 TonB-dependent receptor [Novosphingobium sp. Rr 2-17]
MPYGQRAVARALASAAYFVVPAAAVAQTADSTQTTESGSPEADARTRGIQEIIVTAERRANDVQNTAAAVSVRSGNELAAQGKYLLRQVLDDIPGVVATENRSNNTGSSDVQGNNITIRGITPGDAAGAGNTQISATPPTAIYVDGVYEGVGSTYDLGRVEVLRGPQGTLYGRSATAGVVAFHTRNPTLEEFDANGSFEYGNYDLQHYTAGMNVPLGSTLALRVSGDYRDQGEGYFGEADRGMRKRTSARAKLLWQATDELSVLLGYAYEKDRANSGGNQTTSNQQYQYTTITSPTFPGRKEQNQYWAEVNWDLGPVLVTYLPAYRTWTQNDYYLQSGNFIGSGAQLQQIIQTPKDTFHTQELRIASNGDSALKWQFGAFYYDNKLRTSNRNFLADANNNEIALQTETSDEKDTKNIGVFAESTYEFSPSTRVTLGARYDYTKVTVSEYSFENAYSLCGTAVEFSILAYLPAGVVCTGPGQANVAPPPGSSLDNYKVSFHNFNYKARIEHDLSLRNMVYASVSTGFRPGDAGISQGVAKTVDAEKLTAFEIGSKNRFLGNSLQFNFAAFYYIYEGFQTTFNINDPNNPADYASFTNSVRTTVPARNYGGELELLYQPSTHDRLTLNYNYLQSRWVNKPADFAAAQPETKRAITPHTITASYQHTFDVSGGGTIAARIDGKFESAHLTQNLHADLIDIDFERYVHVGDRLVGNAQVTFMTEDKRYSLTAYVRNFTNAKYPTYVVGADINAMDVNYIDPRIFGIVASARF